MDGLTQMPLGREQMPMNKMDYLNPKELAERINVPVNTIYFWISREEIPFTKMGKHIRFSLPEVMEFFKQKTQENSRTKEKNGRQTSLQMPEFKL